MSILNKIAAVFRSNKSHSLPKHLKDGKKGETAAARYLRRHGYRIVARNFVSGKNEVDIIAEKQNCYVFCEVKTRTQTYGEHTPYGTPSSAVDKEKQRCLIAAANSFYRRHHKENKTYRFDVIEVYLDTNGRITHIAHLERAFSR